MLTAERQRVNTESKYRETELQRKQLQLWLIYWPKSWAKAQHGKGNKWRNIKYWQRDITIHGVKNKWVQGLDLNQGPSGYEPDELPGCSTLQHL